MFRRGCDLHAESAADIRRDHAQICFWNVQNRSRQFIAQIMHHLRSGDERVAPGPLIVITNRVAIFHWIGGDARHIYIDTHDMGRLSEDRVHLRLIANLMLEAEIRLRIRPDQGRVGREAEACIRH